jgi:hypothetical protein
LNLLSEESVKWEWATRTESALKVGGLPDFIRRKTACGAVAVRTLSIQPLRWTFRSPSSGWGIVKVPGKKKPVSGMDITKQLRGIKFMRLFWNRISQKTRLHESDPERRNLACSLEKHPGSRTPDKGF